MRSRPCLHGLANEVREAHRADLHQALAYAALANVDRVDTVLAYPISFAEPSRPPTAIATLVTGTRRVRLLLAGLPEAPRPGVSTRGRRAFGRLALPRLLR